MSAQTDVQAQAIFAGLRPVDDPDGWGYETEERWGTFRSTVDSIACLRRKAPTRITTPASPRRSRVLVPSRSRRPKRWLP